MAVVVTQPGRAQSSLALALTGALMGAGLPAAERSTGLPSAAAVAVAAADNSSLELPVPFTSLKLPAAHPSRARTTPQEAREGTVKWAFGKLLDAWGDWLLPIVGTTVTWLIATWVARREQRSGVLSNGVSGEVVFWTGDTIAVRSFMEGSIPQEWSSTRAAERVIKRAVKEGRQFSGVPFLGLSKKERHIVLDPLVSRSSAQYGAEWLGLAAESNPGRALNEAPLLLTLAYERYGSQKLRTLAISPAAVKSILLDLGAWWRSAGQALAGRSGTHESAATSKCRVVTIAKFAVLAVLDQPDDLRRVMTEEQRLALVPFAERYQGLLTLSSAECSRLLDAAFPVAGEMGESAKLTGIAGLANKNSAELQSIHARMKEFEFFQDIMVPVRGGGR